MAMGIMSSNNQASLPGSKAASQKFYGSRNGCMSRNCRIPMIPYSLKSSKTKAKFLAQGGYISKYLFL